MGYHVLTGRRVTTDQIIMFFCVLRVERGKLLNFTKWINCLTANYFARIRSTHIGATCVCVCVYFAFGCALTGGGEMFAMCLMMMALEANWSAPLRRQHACVRHSGKEAGCAPHVCTPYVCISVLYIHMCFMLLYAQIHTCPHTCARRYCLAEACARKRMSVTFAPWVCRECRDERVHI